MEDFFYAGGLKALMVQLRSVLDTSQITVIGKSVADNIADAAVYNADVIKSLNDPVNSDGATAVLRGNLAPRGCVMKPSAAEKRLHKHRGKVIAFENYDEMAREVERDDLDVTADHILVLKNSGPQGGPGMPEWGMLPIPKKLVKQGVRDMLRISDARMSGTAFGTIVLHITPESAVGGPLALVRNGDMIRLDVAKRSIDLLVDAAELEKRRAALALPSTPEWARRGYAHLFNETILQADEGCDFDFLAAVKGK